MITELKSTFLKKELERYYEQREFLYLHKEDWGEETFNLTKNFYDEKIKEYRAKINRLHPEWLIEFDKERAINATVIDGNEITTKGITVLK